MTPRKRKAWDWGKNLGIGIALLTGYVQLRGQIQAQETAKETTDAVVVSQSHAIMAQGAAIRLLKARIARLERQAIPRQDRGSGGPSGVLSADLGPRPGALAAVGDTIKGAVTLPFRGLWALVKAIAS